MRIITSNILEKNQMKITHKKLKMMTIRTQITRGLKSNKLKMRIIMVLSTKKTRKMRRVFNLQLHQLYQLEREGVDKKVIKEKSLKFIKRRSLQSTVPIRDDRRRALLNGDQDKSTIPPFLRMRFVSSHGPCHISRSTYLHPDKYSQPPPCALVRDLLPR